MWPFKAKKALSQAQKRDDVYARIMRAAEKSDLGQLSHWTIKLTQEHGEDPLAPEMLARAFEALAQKEKSYAMLFCVNFMGQQHPQQDKINAALRPTVLRLMAKLDMRRAPDASTQAMAAQKLSLCATTRDEESFALTSWAIAMDTLIAKDMGNRALAAACNACCTGDERLAPYAARIWGVALDKLARSNAASAAELARAFADKCAQFKVRVPAHIRQMARAR